MTSDGEARRRDRVNRLTVLLCEAGDEPLIFNAAADLPQFALLTPGATARAIGGPDLHAYVADLLGAFEDGDIDSAAVLMGAPPPSTS